MPAWRPSARQCPGEECQMPLGIPGCHPGHGKGLGREGAWGSLPIVSPDTPAQAAGTAWYQSPALPRCSRHRTGAGERWGRNSSVEHIASLASRSSEGWYWACAGALQASPCSITKSRAGVTHRRHPWQVTSDMSWPVSASSRETKGG